MKVSLPLLKAANADPVLTHLLLNHFLSTCAKKGVTIDVPQGAKVEEIPLPLYMQECRILAELHGDDFSSTEQALRVNQAWYLRTQRGKATLGKRSNLIRGLLDNFVALLDGEDSELHPAAEATLQSWELADAVVGVPA